MTTAPRTLFALALGSALFAQQPVTPAAAAAPPASSTDDLLLIKPTPYRPVMVRDPFATPSDSEQGTKGDLIDDIGVKGRVVSGGKSFVVISDSRGVTRKVPVGYKFRDGEVVAIDDKAVTFHQWEINSTNRSAYRTVVKAFKREEGKR